MNELLFYLVILGSNIIQGITGFAGSILAMPFAMRLMGIGTAVPVLNAAGILCGIWVIAGKENRRSIDRRELIRVIAVMGVCVLAGIAVRSLLTGQATVLYRILGCIALALGVEGLIRRIRNRAGNGASADGSRADRSPADGSPAGGTIGAKVLSFALLAAAGLVHGMFVCGGPLLIAYLTTRIQDKTAFRATISAVWIFLNGLILITQLAAGSWSPELLRVTGIAIPFLFGGMFLGGLLYRRMSREFFMILTYVLLIIAGLSLFFK